MPWIFLWMLARAGFERLRRRAGEFQLPRPVRLLRAPWQKFRAPQSRYRISLNIHLQSSKIKSPAGQAGLGRIASRYATFQLIYYSKPMQVEKPCGGRRTRTVMADQATRLLERQRPVPTGNVLQTDRKSTRLNSS